jgi:16S rRNA (guanine527-N7)-methyltransferase
MARSLSPLSPEALDAHIDRALATFTAGIVSPGAQDPEAASRTPSTSGADVIAGSIDPRARAHLATWIALLVEWNARMDLTAARTPEELVDLMLADAMVLAARIPHGARVVDVGSGAGAPGLPLALVRPDLAVTLIEPLTKRVAFLRTVIGTLRRGDVRLERGRGEEAAVKSPEAWDHALSRATLAPPAWLALGARMVRPGGSVWALLAREEAPEVSGLTREDEVAYAWPCPGAAGRAVRYARAAGSTG